MLYERRSKRIQLFRPNIMECRIVAAGNTQGHTARVVVGVWTCMNWMRNNRRETEVGKGAEVLKLPRQPGGSGRSRASVADREVFSCPTAAVMMNDWGGPVSRVHEFASCSSGRVNECWALVGPP